MISYQRENNAPLMLGQEIGGGGEGKIYRVDGEPRLVAKIYIDPGKKQSDKLAAMLANPPNALWEKGHAPLAWPMERIYNWHNQCVGFLMPYIDTRRYVPLLKLYNPRTRLKTLPLFSWKYLLQAATNLTSIMCLMHQNGYVIGDVNESNILVSTSALVTLVDCDSCQVPGKNGRVFRCEVGKPEYTPAELQGRDFHTFNRAFEHDTFGLAVLIFQMLMEGVHPFMGVWKGEGNPPTLEQNIQAGNCPYLPKSILRRQPRSLPLDTLPPQLQTLMIRCFGEGHRTPEIRPSAEEWFQGLRDAEEQIVSCRFNGQHWYSKHLSVCPWCERIQSGLPDSFPMQAPPPPLPPLPESPRATRQFPTYTSPQLPSSTIPQHAYLPQTYPTQANIPLVGQQQTGANPPHIQASIVGQRQQQMFMPQQMAASLTTRKGWGKGLLVGEMVLSIFGVFGIGWCLAGKWGWGLLLLLGSFLLYLPIATSMLQGGNAGCVIVFAIGAIVFNAVQLNGEIESRAKNGNP